MSWAELFCWCLSIILSPVIVHPRTSLRYLNLNHCERGRHDCASTYSSVTWANVDAFKIKQPLFSGVFGRRHSESSRPALSQSLVQRFLNLEVEHRYRPSHSHMKSSCERCKQLCWIWDGPSSTATTSDIANARLIEMNGMKHVTGSRLHWNWTNLSSDVNGEQHGKCWMQNGKEIRSLRQWQLLWTIGRRMRPTVSLSYQFSTARAHWDGPTITMRHQRQDFSSITELWKFAVISDGMLVSREIYQPSNTMDWKYRVSGEHFIFVKT